MARIVTGPAVNGQAVSEQTRSPLAAVTITVSSTVYTDQEMTVPTTTVITDGSGRFTFYAAPGTYTFISSDPNTAPIEPVEVLSHEGAGQRESAAYDHAGAAVTRLRAAVIGSSRESGGGRDTASTVVQVGNAYTRTDKVGIGQAGPQSWFTHACLQSGGRLVNYVNAGVGSDTTSGMLARFQADVIAKMPPGGIVFIGDAHNDFSVGSGISEATTRSNIDAMILATLQAALLPVLYTCLPDNSSVYANLIRRHNAWLKGYAEGKNKRNWTGICVDINAAVTDPASTSGAYLATMTSDNTHLTNLGASTAGARALADLGGLLRGNASAPIWLAKDRTGGPGRTVTLTAATTASTTITASAGAFTAKDVGRAVTWVGGPAGVYIAGFTSSTAVTLTTTQTIASGTVLTLGPHTNLILNPFMQDDINTDGVSDGYAINGTGVTKTLVTDAAVLGNAQQLAIASSTSTGYQQLTVDGLSVSVGDRLKWTGMAKVTAAAGSLNWDLEMTMVGASPAYVVKPLGQIVGFDLGWFYFECEGVVPAGTTQVRFGYQMFGGTGTLWLAQQGVYNMSQNV